MQDKSNTPNPSMGNTMPKRSVNAWMIVAIIFILISIGLGVYGFITIRNQNNKINILNSQVADLQNTKKTLEDAAAAVATAATKAVTSSSQSPSDAAKIAAINWLEAETGEKNGQTFIVKTIKVSKDGNFASVEILPPNSNTGNTYVILKKVNGSWVAIGESLQYLPEWAKYGVPQTIE